MRKAWTIVSIGFSAILVINGCSTIDHVVVPINDLTRDLNSTNSELSMPTEIFPNTKIRLKGTKLAIEKNF